MSSIKNMFIGNSNIASSGLAVEKIGMNNLDLYIPRISENHSEDKIKIVFADMCIGIVSYVDFVAIKDPETKEIKFYSAFLRLTEWHPDGFWFNKIIVEKQNKIQVTRSEFWITLPAKTPLSRSKVNTHQLAAYTDELYVRVEAIEKGATENITVSSTHFQNLLAKSEAQAIQIDQLLKIVAEQSNQLVRINDVLFQEEPKKIRTLSIDNGDLWVAEDLTPISCGICSKTFTKTQIDFHSMFCKQKEQAKPEKKPVVFCDDECFFMKPLNITDTTKHNSNLDITSGTFTFDIEDVLGPVAKSFGITSEEVRKGLNAEFANSKRAKSSINYCGNA
jgi:hypothetical protein